jgi:hypothetical protein
MEQSCSTTIGTSYKGLQGTTGYWENAFIVPLVLVLDLIATMQPDLSTKSISSFILCFCRPFLFGLKIYETIASIIQELTGNDEEYNWDCVPCHYCPHCWHVCCRQQQDWLTTNVSSFFVAFVVPPFLPLLLFEGCDHDQVDKNS